MIVNLENRYVTFSMNIYIDSDICLVYIDSFGLVFLRFTTRLGFARKSL